MRFLEELSRNNRREWFEANKERYERSVRDRTLRFISDIGPKLRRLGPHFVADPRPVGGSMFRIFWQFAADLQREDPRIQESTIMNGRCLRVGKEFPALVDYKGSGLVVKLPEARVAELVEAGVGKPFGPAGKIFKQWLAVPKPDRRRWRALLQEGIAFVGR